MPAQSTKPNYSKQLIVVLILLLIIGFVYLFLRQDNSTAIPLNNQTSSAQSNDAAETTDDSTDNQTSSEIKDSTDNAKIPPTLQLNVPFTPQAPTANWDELHNEACEEASAIMANAYFNNITSLPPAIVETQIDKLTEWQQNQFGYHLSITTEETIQMIQASYGLEARAVNISKQVIKQALADGKLVLVPVNGQLLGNPYFKQPGPIYHMFVITGYDSKQFITNDPGTRRGENYKYNYDIIEAATGNWNHDAHEVDFADKKIIIVSKITTQP